MTVLKLLLAKKMWKKYEESEWQRNLSTLVSIFVVLIFVMLPQVNEKSVRFTTTMKRLLVQQSNLVCAQSRKQYPKGNVDSNSHGKSNVLPRKRHAAYVYTESCRVSSEAVAGRF